MLKVQRNFYFYVVINKKNRIEMKLYIKLLNSMFIIFVFLNANLLFSQQDSISKTKSLFWQKVQFGGGLGLGVGNGYTNLSLSPTAYYNFNERFAAGFGLIGSYVSQNSNNQNILDFKSTILGASLIGLVNPIEEIQLSAELEELNVDRKFDDPIYVDDNFWNTALFLGAGYRSNNVIVGVKFNVLHQEDNEVYSQSWMPFFRVMF